MQTDLDNQETDLNKYCIDIKISESELFNIPVVCDILDGISYKDYIKNY